MMTEDFRAFFLKRSGVRISERDDESRDRSWHQFKEVKGDWMRNNQFSSYEKQKM